MNTMEFSEKDKRDEVFLRLKYQGEGGETSVVRWSDPVPMMVSESEFLLDERGRVIYRDKFYLAYPQEASAWKHLLEERVRKS